MSTRVILVIQITLFLIISPGLRSQNIEDVKREENRFIYSDAIKLFPGDTLVAEASVNGNKLIDFKKVSNIADSSLTIVFSFTYEKFGSDNATVLKVVNPFPKTLKYKAKFRSAPWRIYSEASIIPVLGKIFGIELWPYKIESIILYNFTLGE